MSKHFMSKCVHIVADLFELITDRGKSNRGLTSTGFKLLSYSMCLNVK